jgi:glycosyltransferase involved in cell wall biosynthesis
MNIGLIASLISFHAAFNIQNIEILTSMGHKVHLFGNITDDQKKNQKINKFLSYCDSNNLAVHVVDIPRSPRSLFKIFKSYKILNELLRQENITFVHSHTPVGGLLGRLCSSKCSIKNIYTAHGFHFYTGAPLFNWMIYYPIEMLLAKKTDAVITINYDDFNLSKNRFKTSTYYIPGVGVDTDLFSNEPNRSILREIRLVSVGELNKNKNHYFVIKALSNAKLIFRYAIAGLGPLERKLDYFIKKSNLHKSVDILGYVNDVSKLLSEADIYIMPSLREGLPVSVLEAMASGLPVIASNIRGNRDLIDDGQGGFLFEKGNQSQLIEQIKMLADNPKLRFRMGKYNQIKVKQFDSCIVSDRMREIYQDVFNISK